MELKRLLFIFAVFKSATANDVGTPVTYLMLVDKTQQAITQDFESKLRELQFFSKDRQDLFINSIVYDSRFPEESNRRACRTLKTPLNAIFDFTLGGWQKIKDVANITGTPYLQVELTEGPFYRAVADYVQNLKATKAAFIFQNELGMISAEYALGEEFQFEAMYFVGINPESATFLKATLDADDFVIVCSRSKDVSLIFNQVIEFEITTPEKIIVVLLDFEMSSVTSDLDDLGLNLPDLPITLVRPSVSQMCCPLMNDLLHYCKCKPETQVIPVVISRISDLFLDFVRRELSLIRRSRRKIDYCNLTMDENLHEEALIMRKKFQNLILDVLPEHPALEYDWDKMILGYQTVLEVVSVKKIPWNDTSIIRVKRKTINNMKKVPEFDLELTMRQVAVPPVAVPDATPKKTYIVAFMDDEPWSYRDGNRWLGYCVDLMQKLSEILKITYTPVRINDLGLRNNPSEPTGVATFTGTYGQLIRGDVDIIAAPVPVTTDRDDLINFVEPYFERNGLMIVTMLPQISKSLFKFMTVLSPAVWLSTFGGLIAMSIILYVLEILSPFSYRNDPARYPYPCRVFSYKECIWFSATSFTPQGGGEAPRSLSARVVVFGYWVFVVLMLSTFTSNLAAFLTVERAQSAIVSLEALARQTRVNYGVQKGGNAARYFQNMKDAEDTLYALWVKRVEDAPGEAANVFRTWNYPVKEMFKIIWESMLKNGGFLDTPAEGIRKVLEHPDGSYAFIHDAAWIKYEVLQDCRLAEVGEIFGEQPVAMVTSMIAESLSSNLSEAILALQRDRFFEELTAKHWNQTFRSACEGDKSQEGMSMESIGGIFIFTFGGLATAFVTVLLEVLYQRKVVMARARRTTKAMFATTPPAASETESSEIKIKKKKRKKDATMESVKNEENKK